MGGGVGPYHVDLGWGGAVDMGHGTTYDPHTLQT